MGKRPSLDQDAGRQSAGGLFPEGPLSGGGKQLPAHAGLLLILPVFLILTILHSFIVPITLGEDELAHYRYISFIAQNGRLPIGYGERQQAWYRADWPPLYHLTVGWVVRSLDTTQPHLKDVGETPRRRLVGEIFYPRLIIYTEDANWPWQDGILAWHIGRFISILFSAGALVFTYLTVVEMSSEEETISPPLLRSSTPLLALAATALLAFTPRYLFSSAMLSDDSLLILLSAVFIWLLLRALRGDDRWWLYGVLGLVLGLSIATKYSTGLLPLAVIPVVLWRARQAGWRWWQWLGRLAVSWLATAIGSSWWFGWIGYYFNTIGEDGLIRGLLKPILASGPDVSMRRAFAFLTGAQFTGLQRPDAIEAGTFGEFLTYLFQTYWGVPVLEQDPLFPWIYLLLLVFCLLALFGLWQTWRTANSQTRVTLGVLALIIVLLLPFLVVRFFLTRNVLETGQGRHILYPAAQAIPVLLVLGWVQVIRLRAQCGTDPRTSPSTQQVWYFIFYVPLIIFLLWSVFQLAYMAITYPAPLPVKTTTFDEATISQPLRHNFGDDIQLLGSDFAPYPEQSKVNLTLYWRSLDVVEENYRTQVQLIDPSGQSHFTWLSHPLDGRYPTRAWDEGDVVRDSLSLPLAGVAANSYTVQLDLLHEADDTSLTGEPVRLVQFEVPSRSPIVEASSLGEVDYRLWIDENPVRYRQTLPLSWIQQDTVEQELAGQGASNQTIEVQWALLGPDDVQRLPVATEEATTIFIVGPDWPSGDYRLQMELDSERYQSEPLLTVANDLRLFDLPANLTERADWTPVEASFANLEGQGQVKLLGYTLPTRRVDPGSALPLILYWQSLAPVQGDYLTFAVLLDANQQPYGNVDRYPAGFYSPILWAQDEVVIDEFTLPVRADAPPGIYFVHLGQYHMVDGQPVSLRLMQNGQLTDATAVVVEAIKVGGPPPGITVQNPTPQTVLNQPVGDQITLLGYDMSVVSEQPAGKRLNLRLYWRANSVPIADYTTFVHLRDAANQTVTQIDRPPANSRYPTSLWDQGEIIVDEVTLPLKTIAPGKYSPVVGLYEFSTGDRLTVPGLPANEVILEPIRLKE